MEHSALQAVINLGSRPPGDVLAPVRPHEPEGLGNVGDGVNIDAVADLGWELGNVAPVLRRYDGRLDAGAQRADELLLDTTNGQDASAERDFALEGGGLAENE